MEESTEVYSKVVIDASALLSELMADENAPDIVSRVFDGLSDGTTKIYAPSLLMYEVTNAIKSTVIRKRVTPKNALSSLKIFLELDIDYLDVNFTEVLKMAINKKISAYDACYALLSKQEKAPLLTLDKKLSKMTS